MLGKKKGLEYAKCLGLAQMHWVGQRDVPALQLRDAPLPIAQCCTRALDAANIPW